MVPLSDATLIDQLRQHAATRGDEPAIIVLGCSDEDVTALTWSSLLRQADIYARRYQDANVQHGDVVMFALKHGPSMYPAFLGAMLAGAIPSFLSFPTPKQDRVLYWDAHRALFERIVPDAVLTYAENAGDLAAALPAQSTLLIDDVPNAETTGPLPAMPGPDPDSIALLQHSSGTTGHKKGVMLTYRQVARHVESYARAVQLSSASRVASWLPLYHDMGLMSAFLMPVHLGATVVSLDAFEWVNDPHWLLRVMDRYQADYTWLPNFALNHLVRTKRGDETYRLDHVRAVIVSAEPCKPATLDRFVEAFAEHGFRDDQLLTMYGMAETVLGTTHTRLGTPIRRRYFDRRLLADNRAVERGPGPAAVEFLSNGPALDGLEIRVDPQALAAPGDAASIGELQVRGSFAFDGYYRNAEATAAAFCDGWYRTGDLGCVVDGEAFVMGRKKDVIIYHGVNYYAHDLEAIVNQVAGVKPGRCVALAVFDDESASERIEIVVEQDPDRVVASNLIASAVKQAVASHYPVAVARVHVVEPGWLVKTTSGKISRHDNLDKLLRTPPAAPSVVSGEARDLTDLVLERIASTFFVDQAGLGRSTVAADVNGWDSLGHTVLMIRIGQALGVDVPESVAARAGTVGELIDLLAAHLDAAGRGVR